MSRPPSVWTFFWFALWAGLCVACIYFCQPLLHAIGTEFDVSDRRVSLVATATQIGYAIGIFVLVPLGDFVPRKTLVRVKMALLSAATLGCALSPTLSALATASFFVGVFATTAQDIVPIAADLAPAARRGRYLGYVMSGLMLGILLSRTLAGAISGVSGWRTVFVVGSLALAVSLGSTFLAFPELPPRSGRGSLLSVYASMAGLVKRHPLLRVAVVRHGLLGFAFSAFWTSLAFFLSAEPYRWSETKIGMMGLAGAAGVLASSLAGRIADARGPLFAIRIAIVVVFASFVAMGLGRTSAAVIVAGTIVFDVAVQSSLVSHQSIIYGLEPEARARINGVFVSSLFVFFSLGSYASAVLWSRWGWPAVMTACAISSAASWLLTMLPHAPKAPSAA